MAWAKMAEPIMAKADPALMSAFAVEFALRVKAVSAEDLAAFRSCEEALEVVRHGWDITHFPDYPGAVTARTHLGWAYLPAGTADPGYWAQASEPDRRSALNMTTSRMFAFASLGAYADAIFAAPAARLVSGVFALVRPHVSEDEHEAMQFLYALGGTVTVPERLFTVQGLAAPTCTG